MSYYYVENRYPTSDPNTDLNFNNDILYSRLFDDDLDKNNIPYNNDGIVPIQSKNSYQSSDNSETDNTNGLYILFILIIVISVAYCYKKNKLTLKKSN
jgi:hypothetical protein